MLIQFDFLYVNRPPKLHIIHLIQLGVVSQQVPVIPKVSEIKNLKYFKNGSLDCLSFFLYAYTPLTTSSELVSHKFNRLCRGIFRLTKKICQTILICLQAERRQVFEIPIIVLIGYDQVCSDMPKVAKIINLQYLLRNDRLDCYDSLHTDRITLRLNQPTFTSIEKGHLRPIK